MTRFKKIWTTGMMVVFLLGGVMRPVAWAITVQEEEELSQEFMEYVDKQYKLVKDPDINNYINDLGQKLLAQFPQQPFDFHFYVVEQDVYNAFAGPAGHVFINSGLFAAMDNESELAGILGHEISHVVCRHISESIDRSGKIQMGTLAGVMAGILLGVAGGAGTASEAVVVSSMAAGQSAYLTYSRDDEREADETGVKVVVGAGYQVQGMVSMLKKIKDKDWYGSDIPSYLSTHPGVDDRIVYLSRFLNFDENSPAAQPKPELAFKRAHARVLALYGDTAKAAAWFKAQAKETPESFIPEYGLGLLALREKKYDEAETYFRKTLEKRAFDPYVLSDLGKSYFMRANYTAARSVLEPAVKLDSRNLEGRLYLGQSLMELKEHGDAQRVFERLYADAPDYTMALYYLGENDSRQGKNAESHYYLGLYYLKTGDTRKATFNLQRARTEAEDDALRGKIDDALKQAEEKDRKDKKKDKDKDEGSQDGGEGSLRGWTIGNR